MRIRTAMVGAAVAALALVPAAQAGGGKAKTTITAEFNESAGQPAPHSYTGKVKSPKPACAKNRTIRLKGQSGVISEGGTGSDAFYTLQEDTPSAAGQRTLYALPNEKCKSAKITIFGGG
jgi:hypothetical protein